MRIRRLLIENYQGVRKLEWAPGPGLNVLIGPADAGKTTILSALGLLFSSRSAPAVSEYDYHRRCIETGFAIEAVVGNLSDALLASMSNPPIQGWRNNTLVPLPEAGDEPVIVARVTANSEFEVSHELLADDGTSFALGVGLRQRFLFTSRLMADDSARNELRLVRGSALERRLTTAELRSSLTAAVVKASAELGSTLPLDIAEELETLKSDFEAAGIPHDLALGIVAQEGLSPMGLLGLLNGPAPEEAIPMFRSGTGTRRLALAWVTKLAADSGLMLAADEPEIGLEPYRQRALIRRLRVLAGETGQGFVTTHSVVLLSTMQPAELWRLVPGGTPTSLSAMPRRLLAEAPEAFLCRIPILCEGVTEVGFLGPILQATATETSSPLPDDLGITLLTGTGQPHVLREAEALLSVGIRCGVFADNEADHTGLRARLAADPNCALGTWLGVRNVEEGLAAWLPLADLDKLVELAALLAERQTPPYQQQVRDAAAEPGTGSVADLVLLIGEDKARAALGVAMQKGKWFKSLEGGRALAAAVLDWGIPSQVKATTDAFWSGLQRLLV